VAFVSDEHYFMFLSVFVDYLTMLSMFKLYGVDDRMIDEWLSGNYLGGNGRGLHDILAGICL
jgi:hypothetical protein